MRRNLLHAGYKELTYEIREIVNIAEKVENFWIPITWENIWDPIQKWEQFPEWMREIVIEALRHNETFWYSPSKWILKTRKYLAEKNGKISPEDIIFFNGLWEAISKIYGFLNENARILWPNPAYPTHSSAEASHAADEHITYTLDPKNNWNPNLEEIENKIKFNPNIAGILVINPDNPTGIIFKREILEGIIEIARRYNLFVIFDEIYEKLVYDEKDKVTLWEIIWEVPWISMKWISKELPWPGSRCWRIEVYNKDKDENFSRYIDSIFAAKRLEVCSTTLPQYIIPTIYENPRFTQSLQDRIKKYQERANLMEEYFTTGMNEIIYVKPKWAYYVSMVFNMDYINENFLPHISQSELKEYILKLVEWKRFDKKFCYTLLANTGICVVPLSGFNSTFEGFRMTLLENDLEKFKNTLKELRKFIEQFRK